MNKIPPFLYHGTRTTHMESILAGGLRPRGETGNSQWEHTVESRPDAVYLTTTYPLYFGVNGDGDGDVVIFEVDTAQLDHSQLIADEDALALCLKEPATQHLSVPDRARYYRTISHEYSAADSLARLGTCAHLGTVPRKALRRALLIPLDQVGKLIAYGMDPVISPYNFKFFGTTYEESVAWLFGDKSVCTLNPDMPRVPAELLSL